MSGMGPHPGLVSAVSVVTPSSRVVSGGHTGSLAVRKFWTGLGHQVSEVPSGVHNLSNMGHLLDATAAVDAALPPAGQRPGSAAAGLRDVADQHPSHADFAADIGVVVSFGYFMPASLLSRLRLGAINMHPSLLPSFRGAAPIPHAILSGCTETGVSVIEIHPQRFDSGAVLHQERHAIAEGERCSALRDRLAQAGARAVLQTLSELAARRRTAATQEHMIAAARAQDPSWQPPRAPKLHTIQGLLSWGDYAYCHDAGGGGPSPAARSAAAPFPPTSLTVSQVMRMARAFDGAFALHSYFNAHKPAAKANKGAAPAVAANAAADFAPTASSLPPPSRVLLLEVRPVNEAEASVLNAHPEVGAASPGGVPPPGSLCFLPASRGAGARTPEALFLRLVDGWLALDKLQVEHRKAVSGGDFARGYHIGQRTHAFVNPPAAAALPA